MAHDVRAIMAAKNNADLYEAVFAGVGRRFERLPFAFVGIDRPPPYYSHLTVLEPGCTDAVIAKLRALADRFEGSISFKDSFCEFDLQAHGFELLFEASWLWRAAQCAPRVSGWSTIKDPLELARWEAAWKRAGSPTPARMFPDATLRSADVRFLGKKKAGKFVCGSIANRSVDCVGISNAFSTSGDDGSFEEAAAAVASIEPGLPTVGYAGGPQLQAAERAGFDTTGSLRVLAVRNALSTHCGHSPQA